MLGSAGSECCANSLNLILCVFGVMLTAPGEGGEGRGSCFLLLGQNTATWLSASIDQHDQGWQSIVMTESIFFSFFGLVFCCRIVHSRTEQGGTWYVTRVLLGAPSLILGFISRENASHFNLAKISNLINTALSMFRIMTR